MAGAEERRSIAVLAVGGQTLSLLAVPVFYSLLDELGRLLRPLRPAPDADDLDAARAESLNGEPAPAEKVPALSK